jgi:hypothetical protein
MISACRYSDWSIGSFPVSKVKDAGRLGLDDETDSKFSPLQH